MAYPGASLVSLQQLESNEETAPNSIAFHSWLKMAAANPLPFDFIVMFHSWHDAI